MIIGNGYLQLMLLLLLLLLFCFSGDYEARVQESQPMSYNDRVMLQPIRNVHRNVINRSHYKEPLATSRSIG